MEHVVSYWTDFYEILYLSIFRKCEDEIQGSLKSDKNNGTSHIYLVCVYVAKHRPRT
jgi:hypothetical protein